LAQMVVNEINAQPFWWQPLKPEYKAWKQRNELSEEMLKATEDYITSIGVQESRRGKNSFSIRVGVPYRKHRESDVELNALGMIHEFGSEKRKIPARPHWGPAIKRCVGRSRRFCSRRSVQNESSDSPR
jgi:hypothetical protein